MGVCAFLLFVCFLWHLLVVRHNEFYIYYCDWYVAEEDKVALEHQEQLSLLNQDQTSSGSLRQKRSIAVKTETKSASELWATAKYCFMFTDGLLVCLMYTYVVSFAVYPGLAFDTTISFFSSFTNETNWFILFMNTLFSLFDTFGRWLGGRPSCDMDPLGIKLMSLGRSIFIATFLFIALQVRGRFIF